MGSPLGYSLANVFLCHHEAKWLDNCPQNFKPLLYRRYVDDTFMLFRERSHIPLFLNYLNQQHPNIKFTHEIETNDKLNFLDVTVEKYDNFKTAVYRKGAFRLCNFVSNFLVAREKLLRKLQARAIFRTRLVWIFIAWIFIARNFIAQ